VRAVLESRRIVRDAIRSFFSGLGHLEVETPLLCRSPGIDRHIDALGVTGGGYLATSPELQMKRLLASGSGPIFQLTRSFRAGERGRLHNPEFAMLEWYSPGRSHVELMAETESLVRQVAGALDRSGLLVRRLEPAPFERITVDRAFESRAGWRPSLAFEEDRFFADLVDRVEPFLAGRGAIYLHDFPVALASLARPSADDPGVAERFELYLDGIELCNGFGELSDRAEHERRFAEHNRARLAAGKEPYPVDERFLDALESGLPECSGNALGVDRLLMVLTGAPSIDEVIPFPHAGHSPP
jgi:lysyl-tRNA synthetase class 2